MKIILLSFLCISTLLSQTILPVKIDDFSSTKSWWDYHRDGLVADDPQSIINGKGYLKIRLLNPENSLECNVGISERQSIYSKRIKVLTTETRVKLLNNMLPGSRGWGFWKAAKMGKADNLAWFMEQHLEGKPKFSWSRFGTIQKKRVDLKDIAIKENEWHTYKIVRDLNSKRTDYFVDGELYHTSGGIAPTGRMGFHLWIDNQVYSRSKGIQRAAWSGTSEMVVDYVKIYSGYNTGKSYPVEGSIKVYEKPLVFGNGTNNEKLIDQEISVLPGKTIVLMSVNAESYADFDRPDKLTLRLSENNNKVETAWHGSNNNKINKILELDNSSDLLKLEAISENTPFISDLLVLNSPSGKVLLNESENKNYSFISNGKPVVIYLSAIASESPGWNHIDKSTHDDKSDDHLSIEIDGKKVDYPESSLDGNRQFGLSDIIVVREHLPAGKHTLKIYVENKPVLNRVLVFQE
ncbi:MAG: hypothetical protein D8M58_13055 [Calditrichaeota bacterium]|nr:MAG: hypothetical protein DWQ03_13840 [Calditrichota bacterium]MBL1206328.1 hypothetical protein [Calditrichota bacterium]NOG46154.1 hypothetical protein [Calditrichota bacterium]